jgi:hypothetical protein
MARCDEGYLCEVCGAPVEEIAESDLYLSFVIGELPATALSSERERHVVCNPVQAQFIVDVAFDSPMVEGPFDKRNLDVDYVAHRENLVTRGWQRLQELASLGVPISEYPLEELKSGDDLGLPSSASSKPCRQPAP